MRSICSSVRSPASPLLLLVAADAAAGAGEGVVGANIGALSTCGSGSLGALLNDDDVENGASSASIGAGALAAGADAAASSFASCCSSSRLMRGNAFVSPLAAAGSSHGEAG